jgi:broad specificity phosphatase PhoE
VADLRNLHGKGSLYLVRHGRSRGCSADKIKGRQDFPLSHRGRIQAVQTGRWFKNRNIQTIISSPLKRAAETAEAIASRCRIPDITTLPQLTELDTGVFTGLSWSEAQSRFPEVWRQFRQKTWDGVPGAEPSSALLKRAESFWEHMFGLAESGSGNILAVTHLGIMQWIIKSTLGQKKWMPLFAAAHCGIFMLDYDTNAAQFYCSWELLNYRAYS